MGWTVVWRALMLSLLVILMAAEVPVLHQHSGAAPALYDAECPLAQLLANRSDVSPTERVELTLPLPAIELVASSVLPGSVATSVLPFEPRGPPLSA